MICLFILFLERGGQCINGQRGEAEDEDGSTSHTSIFCTHDHDMLIPIKANRPMTN